MEIDMIMDISNRMERDMRMDLNMDICNMRDEMKTYNEITPKYNETFDFIDSSKEWLANKMSIGQGHYKYICGSFTKSGNKCKNKPIVDGKCHLHNKKSGK
jgi:hypothetical protein